MLSVAPCSVPKQSVPYQALPGCPTALLSCPPGPSARLEASRQALEAEIKEMRKAAKEEMSELKLEQNNAKQVGAGQQGAGA